ncbi:Penicillin-binding protein activator LpoA [Sulfitobacter sp. THAF37]|uniref:penicillin-binding protein activator n=1 Tax=Sulfitobacter sp. THAF37 TaxID=2587855 RepID=UPI001268C40A|nr:penicillin-binding protein activator [Sulfitobacter sp. THAF37]QFT58115.1 Penicillin-binding protein activator LpoA [Sulfitobacter sp. THAF37]
MLHPEFSQSNRQRTTNGSLSRRRLLQILGGSSALFGLGACDGGFSLGGGSDLPPAGAIGQAALLAPLSGSRASIGQIMAATASLGGQPTNLGAEVAVVDAGDDAATAVTAATTAVASGAKMILGPLFSAQARAVAAAVGRNVPVVSLSNDSSIAGGNLFVFGLTPQQSARAVIGFAATRGKRNIAVVVPPGAFGQLAASAAQTSARAFGVTMPAPLTLASADGVVARLKEANSGKLPDAVYLPVVGGPFEAQAGALKAAGVQLLGSEQWGAIAPFRVPALIGGWFAAPDPVRFEAFATALESEAGSEAGIVAGLTFDAVEMARILGRLDRQSRSGLLREAGFDGVLGPYRFTKDGQCERGLAVLSVVQGATTLIGASAA